MSSKRLFYVLYVDEESKRGLLDTIRYVANPKEKQSAHVTVRGPYSRRLPQAEVKHLASEINVQCCKVGKFFGDQQSTVFLECDAPEIRRAWRKPHYPQYNPHLTIYDGESREFAEQLIAVLSKHNLCLDFRSKGLAPLVSSKGQRSADLASFVDSDLVRSASRGRVRPDDIPNLAADDRLRLIDALLEVWTTKVEGSLNPQPGGTSAGWSSKGLKQSGA